MNHHFLCYRASLHDAAFLGDVAPQDGDTTGLAVGIIDGPDDFGSLIKAPAMFSPTVFPVAVIRLLSIWPFLSSSAMTA